VDGVAVYGDTKVPQIYLQKKTFRGQADPNQVIEGYVMPPNPNMLNWSSEKPIEVTLKPDMPNLWHYVEPMQTIQITRVSDDIVGYRTTPDNPNLHMRGYEKIMNEVILVDSKDFNT
jgi:hypothetical protein